MPTLWRGRSLRKTRHARQEASPPPPVTASSAEPSPREVSRCGWPDVVLELFRAHFLKLMAVLAIVAVVVIVAGWPSLR
jgi:hypothetical protein